MDIDSKIRQLSSQLEKAYEGILKYRINDFKEKADVIYLDGRDAIKNRNVENLKSCVKELEKLRTNVSKYKSIVEYLRISHLILEFSNDLPRLRQIITSNESIKLKKAIIILFLKKYKAIIKEFNEQRIKKIIEHPDFSIIKKKWDKCPKSQEGNFRSERILTLFKEIIPYYILDMLLDLEDKSRKRYAEKCADILIEIERECEDELKSKKHSGNCERN